MSGGSNRGVRKGGGRGRYFQPSVCVCEECGTEDEEGEREGKKSDGENGRETAISWCAGSEP